MPRRLSAPERCRRKFLRFFPAGFRDETYIDWERGYKWRAHEQWAAALGRDAFASSIDAGRFGDIAATAVRIESRTNLLFSYEKMALRDALRTPGGAEVFSRGLYEYVHGTAPIEARFDAWTRCVASLPRRQTRVLTWPLVTVFGFIADPKAHIFLKPNVTRVAAREYGVEFRYRSAPNWDTYRSLLDFAAALCRDLRAMKPRDMIDLQSFMWVQGSEEYDE